MGKQATLVRTAGTAALRTGGELGVTASGQIGSLFVAGRFSVFDQWTEINSWEEGRFMERIAPGAFTRTIREDRPRMRLLFEHGADPFIGHRPIASIDVLDEDGVGVYYAGRLFDTMAARELRPLLEAGVLGSSFRFRVVRESRDDRPRRSVYNPEGLPERTLLDVSVSEFGPVTFPAYSGATAGLASGSSASPPRASRPSTTKRFGSTDEWLAFLTKPHQETAAEIAARERWLDSICPLPL